jgi:hypothetical protein
MVETDEKQQLRWVADWRASGLTADEFAGRHGLSVHTLRYWAYRKKKGRPEVSSLAVVRVEREAAPAMALGRAPLVVEVGDARVIVPAGADGATLRMVFNALRSTGSAA